MRNAVISVFQKIKIGGNDKKQITSTLIQSRDEKEHQGRENEGKNPGFIYIYIYIYRFNFSLMYYI